MSELRTRTWISMLILAVLVTGAVTCRLARGGARTAAGPAVSTAMAAAEQDPLTRFRTEREQLRQWQKAQLNEIIYSASGDSEIEAQARRQLMSLMAREEKEQAIEGILAARGFSSVLASLDEQGANVIVRRQAALTQREAAVILDLVMRETGLTGGNVKIIPIVDDKPTINNDK